MTSVVFPPELITEILSRLPVKSLLRFRCVSKPWCSLINSQEFVKKHLNQSMITKTNLNLILGFRKNIFSVSLHSVHPTGVVSLENVERLSPPPFSGSVVLNSCNGLSLVVIKNPQIPLLCIWNPFTRKYRELPGTPIEYPMGHDLIFNFMLSNERYAFAYVSETDEYKVVRVVEFSRIDSFWLCSEAKIFSSRSNEWERIEPFPYRLSYKRIWGAHLNSILHTVVKTDSSPWSIMGFDVRSKEHAMVPNPELGDSEDFDITVEVLGGYLCLINQHLIDLMVMDVWVMKDYGVKDSWFKLLAIAPKSVEPPRGYFPFSGCLLPLAYSEDGEEVLLNEIDERIFWYSLRSGTVREITVNMTSEFYTEVCFESLVSFPGFISVENVKGKSQGVLKKDSKEKRSNKKRGISLKKGLKLVL